MYNTSKIAITLYSGEYEDKQRTEAPTDSIIYTIESRLCADKLSLVISILLL
jgi:hypothetical protein